MWSNLFHYEPESGDLLWKRREREMFKTDGSCKTWNTRFAMRVAGHQKTYRCGERHYTEVELYGQRHSAHRIIWEMHNGAIPLGMEIDHVDRDPWNNKLSNLRLCTRSQNMMNRRVPNHNTSGYKRVSWNNVKKGWEAQIKVNRKTIHLGSYDTKELAAAEYAKAATMHHGTFKRLT